MRGDYQKHRVRQGCTAGMQGRITIMAKGKPRVLATRHFPPDVETRLAANFDAVLNPQDKLYDGARLAEALVNVKSTRASCTACTTSATRGNSTNWTGTPSRWPKA